MCECACVFVCVCMYVCVYVRAGQSEVASWLVAQQVHSVLYSVLVDPYPPFPPFESWCSDADWQREADRTTEYTGE